MVLLTLTIKFPKFILSTENFSFNVKVMRKVENDMKQGKNCKVEMQGNAGIWNVQVQESFEFGISKRKYHEMLDQNETRTRAKNLNNLLFRSKISFSNSRYFKDL